jgi:hypothetical protein
MGEVVKACNSKVKRINHEGTTDTMREGKGERKKKKWLGWELDSNV